MLKLQHYCILAAVLLCSLNAFVLADGEPSQTSNSTTAPATATSTTTVQPSSTTVPPKINILDHAICKKCKCINEPELKQLDCRNLKKQFIFDDEEWKALQNGDVIFEQILLQNNSITQIPKLPAYGVKVLDFSHNQIVNISTAAFQNMGQLVNLDLSHNQLKSAALFPDVFKGQYSALDLEPLGIKELNLGYNKLHNLNADLFEHLTKLEILILCNNVFRMMDEPSTIAIASIRSLKTLDLSYMELDDLPKKMLHGPDKLEDLILSGNIFDSIPEVLTSAAALKSLVLDDNPIGNLEAENIFVKLVNLTYLSISYMPELYTVGPYAFGSLKSLSTLIMASNPHLHKIDKLAVASNTSNPSILNYAPLKRLYLHNNNLTTLDQNFVLRWDLIETIDLRFNPWACDCDNHYIIQSLMVQINSTTPILTKDVRCATPAAWKDDLLLDINAKKTGLVCESDSHPEKNSFILIGLLIGVLLGIPITIASLVIYRRGCFGLLNRGRQGATPLYNRASFSEDFHI